MSTILSKACVTLATLGLSVSLIAAPALAAGSDQMGQGVAPNGQNFGGAPAGGGGGFHGGGGGGGFHGGGGGGFHGGGGGGFHGGGGGMHPGGGMAERGHGGGDRHGGGFGGGPRHGGGYGGGPRYDGGGYDNGYGYGDAGVGLGVVGGAVLGSQLYDNGPGYGAGYYDAAPPQDDGENSQAYCEQTFKSYNPSTGTYIGYDGQAHACP